MKLPTSDVRSQVNQAYSAAAAQPQAKHPFPVGRQFAASIGYPQELLLNVPADAVEAFCGVSNVSVFCKIPEGAAVLDLGCGAGLDTLIAAKRAGPAGKVIAVDFSETMLERARKAAGKCGAANVEFHRADAESLPVEDASVDVALVNGIFNLNPARRAIFEELARVVRPGGAVYASEIVIRDLPWVMKPAVRLIRGFRRNPLNWFA